MKKNGFTLMELLVVIAILAILAIIAVPSIINIYNDAKKDVFITQTQTLWRTAETQWTKDYTSNDIITDYDSELNPLNFSSIDSNVKYHIKMNSNGKVDKIIVDDGNYKIVAESKDELDSAKVTESDGIVISNPYFTKVNSVKELFVSGEENLTSDDIVKVNGIDCYVLKREGNKALLMTKDIYNIQYDGNRSSYRYNDNADIKVWMDNFYANYLGSDEYILSTSVNTYAYSDGYYSENINYNLDEYDVASVTQKTFALDAKLAQEYADKLKWTCPTDTSKYYTMSFFVTAGFAYHGGPNALTIYCGGRMSFLYVEDQRGGARPAFWLSLD